VARLIVKSPYIKGGGASGYLKYIGTREGVELLPSGYMEYMTERPRSHGLFGDEDGIDLDTAMEELNGYSGNIWTHIISLKREDAERLGYDHAVQWRNLLRAHRNEIAEAMHVSPSDFRWYAAFHDEGDHPHVHMMAWSVKPGQAYLSRDGIRKIKAVLTNDIFKQEMLHTYGQKSASRDDLVREARRVMRELTRQMRSDVCDSPEVETLMMTLSSQLETAKGKKKYGYLPKAVKKTVDEIINQLERLSVINDCYQTWWELQCQIEDFYSEKERRRPPLSQQKEFRAVKNAVIQEAENIRMGVVSFEDTGIAEEIKADDLAALPSDCWELWMVTQDDTASMEERDEAAAQLVKMAEDGETYAQYLTGKLYRNGPVLIPDSVEARYWFGQAAQELPAAQYALGALLLSDDSEVRDPELGVKWLEYAAHNGSDYAACRLGKEYLKGEIVEKDAAKAVDHLTQAAETGNQYAQYALGKLYLAGEAVMQDSETAYDWFTRSASQGNEYAQFFLNRWDNLQPPTVMLSVTRLLYHMSRVFRDAVPAPPVPGGIRIDRKRLRQLREKKIAMGHKPDDHEEQSQNWTMNMG